MECWMIVYVLPLEVWMDIFCFPWISRAKFGQIVDKIGNFKFTEHAQFYLHEWGKHKLGDLTFDKSGLYKYGQGRHRLKCPQTPMPENIKSFHCITIHRFDARTMDFLTKISPLLTDLKIGVDGIPPNSLGNLRTIFTILVPMLDGIESVCCHNEPAFSVVREQLFRENEKLAKLKMLKIMDTD